MKGLHFLVAGMLWCALAGISLADTRSVAAKRIPFASMTETNCALVRSVTDHCTMRRDYAGRALVAELTQFEFLLDHMDLCSVMAESVGLIKYRATKDPLGRIQADDRNGATGFILPVAQQPGKRVFYVEGTQGGLFDVRGKGVAVVEYTVTSTDALEHNGAMFVSVDNPLMGALARAFWIFVKGTVDSHYREVLSQPLTLSAMAHTNALGLVKLIEKMPAEDRKLLAPLTEVLTNSPAAGPANHLLHYP